MTNAIFKTMCDNLCEISRLNEPARENSLKLFMSQGYLFLDLTDKQVNKLKAVLKENYPDKFKEHLPDEHNFTAEFEYLRFK